MESLILSVIVLSVIVAMFYALVGLLRKETIVNIFDLFIYSFLGGLLGGFIGTAIGFGLAYIVYLIAPLPSDFGIPDPRYILFWLIGLLAGVLIGGIITIKPLIKFFSNF
ncbi:MAG: hypothetical protein AAFV28_12190 [Cyanobacteria bacterium J06635_13]